MNYYEDPKKAPRKKDVKEKQKIVHGADKFLIWFNTMYQENKYFCNGLLCCLMHIFVEKLSGNKTHSIKPVYSISLLLWHQLEAKSL